MTDILLWAIFGMAALALYLAWRADSSASGSSHRLDSRLEPIFDEITNLRYEIERDIRDNKMWRVTRRGEITNKRATLKGRVAMLEKHLGVTTEVVEEQPAKLQVKKEKKK